MYLTKYPPNRIASRYKVEESLVENEEDAFNLINEIGKKRGLIKKGNIVDFEASVQIILNEFSNGILGKISLDEEGVVWPE